MSYAFLLSDISWNHILWNWWWYTPFDCKKKMICYSKVIVTWIKGIFEMSLIIWIVNVGSRQLLKKKTGLSWNSFWNFYNYSNIHNKWVSIILCATVNYEIFLAPFYTIDFINTSERPLTHFLPIFNYCPPFSKTKLQCMPNYIIVSTKICGKLLMRITL